MRSSSPTRARWRWRSGEYKSTDKPYPRGEILVRSKVQAVGYLNRPDLTAAAASLGVSADALRRALGPPPPDFAAAARQLGISEAQLRAALREAMAGR